MPKKDTYFIICILALGYMIDFFDLTIFAVIRHDALNFLKVPPSDFMQVSALMFNAQAIGIVVGGILSGIWADKFGRISAIRVGILLYSCAILANAFVNNIPAFAAMRFLAGVGLAGEFAVSVTLLSEITSNHKRGYLGGIVYAFGIIGGFLATFIGSYFKWQQVFIIGGFAGIILLVLRMTYTDSLLFIATKNNKAIPRGSLKLLITNRTSLLKTLCLLLAVVPFWFMAFFVNFAPEVAKAVGMKQIASQSISLACYFAGCFIGANIYPIIAKLLSSRKKPIALALIFMTLAISLFGFKDNLSLNMFYSILFIIGFASGYPGIFMVMAAESFGTNQRGIATSVIGSVSRCSLIGINILVPWMAFQFHDMWLGGMICACIFFILGIIPLILIKETHNISLDFHEILSEKA